MNQLIDKYGRLHNYLRISVTDKCNLRCQYCLPNENIIWKDKHELLSFEEIIKVVQIAASIGISKIRITGGEPLLRANITELIKEIYGTKGIEKVTLTTNAILLPKYIAELENYLSCINISLDTFEAKKYLLLTQRDSFYQALQGINSALNSKIKSIKLNCVVIKNTNDDEILQFADYAFNNNIQVRFIEFMPFAGNNWAINKCVSMKDILDVVKTKYELLPLQEEENFISRDYKLLNTSHNAGLGQIGVIASNTQPFCSVCSRLRLSAEGMLMPCLHSSLEYDLKFLLRNNATDSEIKDLFFKSLANKKFEHLPVEELNTQTNRIMIQIGG